MSNPIRSSIDTKSEQEISVTTQQSCDAPETLVVITDSTQIPYRRIYLTVTEARTLAMFLRARASDAEDADLDMDQVNV